MRPLQDALAGLLHMRVANLATHIRAIGLGLEQQGEVPLRNGRLRRQRLSPTRKQKQQPKHGYIIGCITTSGTA
jgi:hypothetical protein